MEQNPNRSEIVAARAALVNVEQQDLLLSPEVVAMLRGAVQALDWVLNGGTPLTVSSLGS